MPNYKMKFSEVGSVSTTETRLSDDFRLLETGYQDALQGLYCVLGRLRAIPGLESIVALSTVINGLDADTKNRLSDNARTVYTRYQRFTALLETVDRLVEESVRQEAFDQVEAAEAARKSEAARKAAEGIAEAAERAFD